MDVETEPKVPVAFDPIIKTCRVAGRIGAYVREPMGPRKWGERIVGTPLVAHKGQFYLEIEVTSVKDEKFFDKESGKAITKEMAVERGYKERPLLTHYQNMKDYKLSSIKTIRMDGKEYNVSI